jgi:thiol-disulfide isomerase/thioredoxin
MSNRPKAKHYGYEAPTKQASNDSKPIALWIGLGVAAIAVIVGIIVGVTGENSNTGKVTQNATISGDNLLAMPQSETLIPTSDPAIGATIPTVNGRSFDDSAVVIKPGSPQLLVFAAHWCPHCQKEIPEIVSWRASDVIPAGVKVTAVSTAVDKARGNYPPASWLKEVNFKEPVMADTTANRVANAFGVRGYPTIIAVTADGKVALRGSGELGQADIARLVAAAKGEAAGATDTTTPADASQQATPAVG